MPPSCGLATSLLPLLATTALAVKAEADRQFIEDLRSDMIEGRDDDGLPPMQQAQSPSGGLSARRRPSAAPSRYSEARTDADNYDDDVYEDEGFDEAEEDEAAGATAKPAVPEGASGWCARSSARFFN